MSVWRMFYAIDRFMFWYRMLKDAKEVLKKKFPKKFKLIFIE